MPLRRQLHEFPRTWAEAVQQPGTVNIPQEASICWRFARASRAFGGFDRNAQAMTGQAPFEKRAGGGRVPDAGFDADAFIEQEPNHMGCARFMQIDRQRSRAGCVHGVDESKRRHKSGMIHAPVLMPTGVPGTGRANRVEGAATSSGARLSPPLASRT